MKQTLIILKAIDMQMGHGRIANIFLFVPWKACLCSHLLYHDRTRPCGRIIRVSGSTTMISKILTLIRENEGLTLQETARKLGISPDEVLRYEKGDVIPPDSIIEEYSDIFGVPVASIEFFSEHDTGGVLGKKTRLFFADKIVQLVEKLMQSKD